MNGPVKTATINLSNMPALTPMQKKKKRFPFTQKKVKQGKAKQPQNGFRKDTADTLQGDVQEQLTVHVDKEEARCGVCKKEGEHELVDLRKNVEMRETMSSFLGVPAQNIEPALSNICVQCVFKINLNTELTRKLKLSLRRVINGQTSNSTKNSTENDNDISTEEKTSTCLQKKSVQKTEKKNNSSPTKSCYKSLKQQSDNLAKPNYINKTPQEESTPCTPLPTATSTPTIAKPARPEHSLKESSTEDSIVIDNCDISPSPAYSPVKPHRTYESNTNSNTLPELELISPVPEVAVRSKKETFLQQPNVPLDLRRRNSSITIHSPTPSPPPISPPPVTISALPSKSRILEGRKESSIADSDAASAGHRNSMLEVFYERSESALVTESGGKINKYKSLPSKQMLCPTCGSSYWRKHYFQKHVRRCRPRSAVSNAEQAIANPSTDVTSALTRAASKKRTFYCNECPVTLDTLAKLRDHKHIHLPRFYCETCGKESMARQDHEFHTIACLAKHMASESNVIEKEQKKEPQRRMTRSMSRAVSRAPTRIENSHISDERISKGDSDEDDDDRFETTSVADTMFTKRMRFTGHWIEDHSNTPSCLSLCNDNAYAYDFDEELSTAKGYDLYLLDRLKMEIHLHRLSCFVPSCKFRADNLVKIMAHEYVDHKMRLWFHCKKCRCGFTSKVHLDYHLSCQNGGRFICYKCGDIFEFQHLLDRHLIRHSKCTNHRCIYCKFEFLSENELLQHCEIEQHNANETRKLISIDHSMTIVNPVPAAPPPERRCYYQVRIMGMRLPKMPTKRPLFRPGDLPYRLRVGEVLFENQKNPNCWGWQ